jgi:hypothetical protein
MLALRVETRLNPLLGAPLLVSTPLASLCWKCGWKAAAQKTFALLDPGYLRRASRSTSPVLLGRRGEQLWSYVHPVEHSAPPGAIASARHTIKLGVGTRNSSTVER